MAAEAVGVEAVVGADAVAGADDLGAVPIAGAALCVVPQSTTQAPNKAALSLQNKGCAASYLRPIKIAANLVLLIEMQFSGHAGKVAREIGRASCRERVC